MKTTARLLAVALLGVTSFAVAQINMPNPRRPGPRRKQTPYGSPTRPTSWWIAPSGAGSISTIPVGMPSRTEFMNIGPDRYAVVYITSANNAGRRVYFRVSSGMDNDDGAMSPGMPPM